MPALRRISAATGVHVIAGTGHYIAAAHDPAVASATVSELADAMISDINHGDADGIKCGVIGEAGNVLAGPS